MIGCRPSRFLICERPLPEQGARYDGVNVHERVGAIDRIKNPPIPNGILGEARQSWRDRFMAQVVHVRRDPFGFVEEPLGHAGINLCEVLDDSRSESEAKPGHGWLPAQSEPVGHVIAGESLVAGEGFFQPSLQGVPQCQPEVRIADEFAYAIVDEALDEFLELLWREPGQIHSARGYGLARMNCNVRVVRVAGGLDGVGGRREFGDQLTEALKLRRRNGEEFNADAM